MLTQQQLKEYLEYRDGHLWWIKKSARCIKIGQQFGSYHDKGYRQGWFKGKMYKEHRLIWLIVYGRLPDKDLDHINGVKDDNKIDNLREATRQENCYNRKAIGGSSKYKGVSLHKCGKWQASYTLNGKQIYLGMFDTELEAAKAYSNFVKPIHREFYHDV